MTGKEVNELAMAYLFSGMPISKQDEESLIVKSVVEGVKGIFDVYMPDIRRAAKRYLDDEDQDAFFIALLPVHNKIWYEAYSPYWLLHCKPVTDRDTETEFTYYNDLIDMYWAWKWQEWKKKGEYAVTIMFPPTKGLVALAYREAQESLRNYMNNTAGAQNPAAEKKGALNAQ